MSDRAIDAGLKTAAQSSEFNYFIAVDLAFPSGTVYAHNSIGTITFGGNDYLGVGALGGISALNESKDLVDSPISLTLSSISSEIIDAIKTDDIYARAANIYIGVLDQDAQLIGTPTNWIAGYMDSTSVTIGENNSVSITIQTKAAKLRRKNNGRWTVEDHQRTYPGDLFFEFLPFVILAQPMWGGERVRIGFTNYSDNLGGNQNQNYGGVPYWKDDEFK